MKGRIKIISVLLIISLLSVQCVVVKKDKDTDKKDSLGKIKNTLQNFKDNQNNKKIKKEEINANKKALKEKEKLEKQKLKEEKQIEKEEKKEQAINEKLTKKEIKSKLDYKISTKFFYKLDMDGKYSEAIKDFNTKDTVYTRVSITGIDETKSKTGNIMSGVSTSLLVAGVICLVIAVIPGGITTLPMVAPFVTVISVVIGLFVGSTRPVDISNNSKAERIEARLYIPNTAGVSSTFYDGKMVESENQDGNTIYKLPIEVQKKEGKENIFIFQIKSEKSADVPIKLIFDEPLTHYNTQSTIRFLE